MRKLRLGQGSDLPLSSHSRVVREPSTKPGPSESSGVHLLPQAGVWLPSEIWVLVKVGG